MRERRKVTENKREMRLTLADGETDRMQEKDRMQETDRQARRQKKVSGIEQKKTLLQKIKTHYHAFSDYTNTKTVNTNNETTVAAGSQKAR